MSEFQPPQGDAVQEGQGLVGSSGKASLRPQAIRLWWSDQARLPQEGKDHEEGCPPSRMYRLQVQGTTAIEAMQAVRLIKSTWFHTFFKTNYLPYLPT